MRRKAPVNSNCKNCTFFKNAIISINYGMIGKKKNSSGWGRKTILGVKINNLYHTNIHPTPVS